MADKTTNNTTENVQKSVSSIYSELLEKRRMKREEKEAEKARRKEEKRLKEESEDNPKKSKKEKEKDDIKAWEQIIVGLTGEDLDYYDDDNKKKKKKYKTWIDDDIDTAIKTEKAKKPKKKNYNKEFESELNMLKNLVADQNKFTLDLQRRFQNAAGPATKDAMPLNKTLVELASAVNASRNNSLGLLREIGGIKKTIADLYMKQKKLESELGGSKGGGDTTDLGLLGSNIASRLFLNNSQNPSMDNTENQINNETSSNMVVSQGFDPNGTNYNAEFDPSTWNSDVDISDSVRFEKIPHSYVVEMNKTTGESRFKAVNDETGEELVGCPVPTSDINRLHINMDNMTVRGEFDETYNLEIIE